MNDLTNKTALVTGASRGIGRATASALARAGAHVIVHYGKSASEADALVEEIRAAGSTADVVAFLASRGAQWITGTTVHVDGGSKL